MKISKLENDIMTIAVEISRERHGIPVLLSELRNRTKINRNDFDQAVLTMSKNGYFLSKDFYPGSRTDAEKADWVSDGADNFFFAINSRDDAETIRIESKNINLKISTKPGRGGSRSGAGRPMKKAKCRRVQLQGARIPAWLMEWLKAEGDVGRKIETALITHYKLTPPEK